MWELSFEYCMEKIEGLKSFDEEKMGDFGSLSWKYMDEYCKRYTEYLDRNE